MSSKELGTEYPRFLFSLERFLLCGIFNATFQIPEKYVRFSDLGANSQKVAMGELG